MQSRSRAPLRQLGPGFTLIELVLVVALLSLLIGAIAFNFSTAQSGKALDEGSLQFESLLRLARAPAAASGRPVHLALLPTTNSPATSDSSNSVALVVLTQPDPLRQPTLFQPIPVTLHLLGDLASLIHLQIPATPATSQESDPFPGLPPAPADPSDPDSSPTPAATPADIPFSPLLTFHPDGSSDPASFILISQDPQDLRRILLQIQPVTGFITRRWLSPDIDIESELDLDNLPDDPDSALEPELGFQDTPALTTP